MATETIANDTPPPLHEDSSQVHKNIKEALTKLMTAITVARPKEPTDQQPVMTSQRGWSLPPSVTNAPLVIKPWAIPRLRLEPPRFDGENAPDWIRKIQKYYNHYYTPLDDRLYLTLYLFDHPASDWREYWVETNKGKSWDDFLLAVEQRFDPEFYEPYATTVSPGIFMGTGWTGRDQRKPNRTTAYPVANREPDHQPPQRKVEITQEGARVGDVIVNIGVTFDQPGVAFGPELHEGVSQEFMLESVADTVLNNVDAPDEGVVLSGASQLILDPLFIADPGDMVSLCCNGRIATDFRENTISEVRKRSEISSHGVDGDGDLFRFEQTLASDGRSIPPCNVVPRLDISFSMSWQPPGSRTADSVSSNEPLPQILLTAHKSLGDDPIESVVFKYDGSNALGALHLELEFPSFADILSIPPPRLLNLEMERLCDQFTAWMMKQHRENMKQPAPPITIDVHRCDHYLHAIVMSGLLEWYWNVLADWSQALQVQNTFRRQLRAASVAATYSQVSAVDGDEVFEQMNYILFYAPHDTIWFIDFILALQSSNGFTSLVASHLLLTFELGQGDETASNHGKEGYGSEADRDYVRPETTISFVPDSTERCQDVSLGGENDAGGTDNDPSLPCAKNKAADGDEGKTTRVFLQVLLHTTLVDDLDEVGNNVIIADGFTSEEGRSWIAVVADLGGEVHATSREFGELVENDLSLNFGRAEERVETAGWEVARQTTAAEDSYVAISRTQHIESPIYALDKPNGVINSHIVSSNSVESARIPTIFSPCIDLYVIFYG